MPARGPRWSSSRSPSAACGSARSRAMRSVLRHRSSLPGPRSAPYNDYPLPIGEGQTISQPYIVALMTELLAVGPGKRVLEIGTGSGYQAAVLSALGAEVYTIEIKRGLFESAGQRLRALGYTAVQAATATATTAGRRRRPLTASSSPRRSITSAAAARRSWPRAAGWCFRSQSLRLCGPDPRRRESFGRRPHGPRGDRCALRADDRRAAEQAADAALPCSCPPPPLSRSRFFSRGCSRSPSGTTCRSW